MEIESPDLSRPRPALTPTEFRSVANSIRAAEQMSPKRPFSLNLPISLRVNGNSPYLLITTEIRRHLDQRGVDFDLTCRNDLDNGKVTWDLALKHVLPKDARMLLDWLEPVYAIER